MDNFGKLKGHNRPAECFAILIIIDRVRRVRNGPKIRPTIRSAERRMTEESETQSEQQDHDSQATTVEVE